MSHHSLFSSDEVKQLLSANGLCNLGAVFRVGKPLDAAHDLLASRHAFKRTVKCELNSRSGTTGIYIKRQWRRERWVPRLADIRRGIALKCSPIHEWQGLRILQDAGFNVAEPLALFWQGLGFSRGAVITRAVPGRWSLADLLLSGELQTMARERLDALIEAATDVVARLHRAKISWRSMKPKHFYPEETAHASWRIWLIDCEGVCRRTSHRDHDRQWRTYLNYIAARAPSLQDVFVAAYRRALNSCNRRYESAT